MRGDRVDPMPGACYAVPMTTPDPHTSPWICDTCKKPIGKGEGVIELVNLDPEVGPIGSPPMRASDDDDLVANRRVGFIVYHHPKCDPYPGQEGYWFTTDRADTLADWCAWLNHLSDKPGWLSRGDMERLNRWWFKNRGLDIYRFGP